MRKGNCLVSNHLPINYKRKNINFPVEKSDTHQLNHMSTVAIICRTIYELFDVMHGEGYKIII